MWLIDVSALLVSSVGSFIPHSPAAHPCIWWFISWIGPHAFVVLIRPALSTQPDAQSEGCCVNQRPT